MAGGIRHLLPRKGRFYARLAVPKALRSIVGKRELLEPLGAGRSEALRALPAAVARMQEIIQRAREGTKVGPSPSIHRFKGRPLSPRELALLHYADQTTFDEELRNTDHLYARGFLNEKYVDLVRQCATGAASNNEMQTAIGWILQKFRANRNIEVEIGTPEWREVARALAIAELESLRRTAERDEGDFDGKPEHPLLTAQLKWTEAKGPLSVRILGPDSSKTLREILPNFTKERSAEARTDYDLEVTVRMFDETLKESRPIYQITRADITAFKRALSDAPANYTKRFHGAKLPDAIEANKCRAVPFPLLNAKTINGKYLSKLHSLLNWCVRNDIIPDNPSSGIKVDVVKGKGRPPRVNFSPDDLARIFDPKSFNAAKTTTEARWAMIISLFSGMRASELAQLKLDSIRQERGILVFAVEEETKTSGSRRIIPLHGLLITRGLEDLVKSLRAKRKTHLFPEWYHSGIEAKSQARAKGSHTLNHYFPRFIPKRFNETYLREVGIIDNRKKWHSFRHTFKTGLAMAGVSRSIQDSLCGHADYSAGGGYIHETSIEAMKLAVDKLQFDGFPLL